MRPIELLDKLIAGLIGQIASEIPIDEVEGKTVGEKLAAAQKVAQAQVGGMSLGRFRSLMAELSKPVVSQEQATVPLTDARKATTTPTEKTPEPQAGSNTP